MQESSGAALTYLDSIWQDLLHQPLLDGRCMWQVYLKELRCQVQTLNTQQHCVERLDAHTMLSVW